MGVDPVDDWLLSVIKRSGKEDMDDMDDLDDMNDMQGELAC